MQNKTDEQLVQKALDDVNSFGLLIERYEIKLMGYVMRISSFTVPEAEDILQEIFLKAWKNLRDFDSDLKFSTWIYRIAHNETISQFRKSRSRGHDKKVSFDIELFDLSTDELSISDKLTRKERASIVHEVLEALSVDHREVLVLKYLEEKSYDEISDILRKPMGTVATLLSRAKKSFKQIILKRNLSF
jgi:RNA polymerase sigma-70 factor (ECF subfamily)